ncbi:MAG: response regulator [Patescibacteria group bacterium]|nr:response regulator [Patescibacteria group bacterium]
MKKTILLVEDDEFLRDIYALKFKKRGFNTRVAEDGIQALEEIEKEIPQVLLLDIILPHIDGWEVLRRIKENPKFEKIKIVMLSALGQKQEVDRAISLGASKFLIKSRYEPRQVVEIVEEMLKSK